MVDSSKSAVVVGGASGMGAALVDLLRSRSVEVTVWDVNEPFDIECDITDRDSVEHATALTLERAGVPDQLTITAGIGWGGLLAEETVDAWDRVMAVNARGPWLTMRSIAREMRTEKMTGSIIAVSSVSAHLVDRNMGLYCASKAALNMLIKIAACEWGRYGIRVNGVAPGVTQTPMLSSPTDTGWLAEVPGRTALGRLGRADDIAAAIVALHDLAWVTGQIVDCDGGLALHSPIDAYGASTR